MFRSLSLPCGAVFCLVTVAANAAQDNQTTYIETIVVTAEREPGNLFLDAQQLTRTQATTLEDMFGNESSMAVGGGSALAQKIYVRGFEDVMLNVSVDGAQSPGELYHHQGRVQLEPEFIETIEVDAGAGAATNGPGALTGTMQATLKDAFDMLDPGQRFGGLVKGTGRVNGSDGEGYTGAVYGALNEKLGVIASYTYQNQGDYEDGHGDNPGPSSYERKRGFAKASGSVGANSYSITYENLDDSGETFERPNLVNFGGTYQISDQEMSRESFSVNYDYTPESDWVDLSAVVYTNGTDFSVKRQNADIYYGKGNFDSTGFDLRNTSVLFESHQLTYGVDYRYDEVDSSQNATPPFAWGDTKQNVKIAGVYAQDDWQLTPSIDVSFGLRYDDYNFSGEGGVSDGVNIEDNQFSPNVSASWEVLDGLRLRAAYAKAFRGVTIREAFFSALYAHDGTLKPEKADNTELGISWDRNGYFARGTLYQQHIKDFIDIEFTGPAPVWGYWRNTGDAKVKGYEAEMGRSGDRYLVSLGVWHADNTLDGNPLADSNMGLGTTIGRTWIGKLRYDLSFIDANVGLDMRYVETVDNNIAPDAPSKDSYFVTNLYTNWQITQELKAAIAVTNLFDEFYYDQATYTYIGGAINDYVGYPAKGREYVASLTYQF